MRLLSVLSGDELANSSPVDRLGAIDEFRNEGVMVTIFGHGATQRIFVLVLMHPLIFLALIEQTTASARWISSLPAPSCPGSSNAGNNLGSHFFSVGGRLVGVLRGIRAHVASFWATQVAASARIAA